jgi:DegV family protein with EDD domain
MTVRIVTDSTAVMPPAWIADHRIEVVPLTIVWEGQTYHDGVDLTYEDFAVRAAAGTTPKTSAPSPGEYHDAYERALQDADELFVVTPPAELSVTFSNATLAAQAVDPARIAVFDARSAAAGQGLVAIEAARAGIEASTVDPVRERASFVAGRVRLVATLQRLDYLRRSGRVPAVAVFATDALNLHPLFRFVNGTPTPMGASRGGRRAADKLLEDYVRSRPRDPARAHAAVMHSSRLEHAEELRDRVAAAGGEGVDAYVVEASAGMAAHLGPGVLGIAWWWEPLP